MHSTGVVIRKNNKVCKCDPCLNLSKHSRLHCSQLRPSFPRGVTRHPALLSVQAAWLMLWVMRCYRNNVCHFQEKADRIMAETLENKETFQDMFKNHEVPDSLIVTCPLWVR